MILCNMVLFVIEETGSSQSQGSMIQPSSNRNASKFFEVTIDNKRLHAFLSSIQIPADKIVCSKLQFHHY